MNRTIATSSMENAWVHCLLTTPYDATNMPESGAAQHMDGGHEDHSHAIDLAQFLEKCVNYNAYGTMDSFDGRCARDSDFTRGLSDHGRSARRPVSGNI